MKIHQLYYSKYCYFCQKVSVFLAGREHSVEMMNTSDPKHHLELLKGGGKGQVPCLRIESQGQIEWMYESDAIINYLRRT
jgi:glutathione S-transferase